MNLSIMIVHDTQDMRDALSQLLASSGFKNLTYVPDTSIAMDLIQNGKAYDIAILALSAGVQTLEFLKYLRKEHPQTECLIVVDNSDVEFALECTKYGALNYLIKPLTEEKLIKAIIEADETRSIPRVPIRILILEDDAVSGKLMIKYLEAIGDSWLVTDGKKAVETFKEAFSMGKPYHLVFLDIMVPEIHGRDVLRMIRDFEKEMGVSHYRRAKIVMTSALSDAGNIIDSFQSQCDAYLIKPIDKNKLMKGLETLGLYIRSVDGSDLCSCPILPD